MLEGVYGKEALRKLGAADDLEPYTLYIKQTGEMFDMVAHHEAYGIFFYSSVISQRRDPRARYVSEKSSHTPIEYFAVVIAGDNMDEARKFLEYLKSRRCAKPYSGKNGFLPD